MGSLGSLSLQLRPQAGQSSPLVPAASMPSTSLWSPATTSGELDTLQRQFAELPQQIAEMQCQIAALLASQQAQMHQLQMLGITIAQLVSLSARQSEMLGQVVPRGVTGEPFRQVPASPGEAQTAAAEGRAKKRQRQDKNAAAARELVAEQCRDAEAASQPVSPLQSDRCMFPYFPFLKKHTSPYGHQTVKSYLRQHCTKMFCRGICCVRVQFIDSVQLSPDTPFFLQSICHTMPSADRVKVVVPGRRGEPSWFKWEGHFGTLGEIPSTTELMALWHEGILFKGGSERTAPLKQVRKDVVEGGSKRTVPLKQLRKDYVEG